MRLRVRLFILISLLLVTGGMPFVTSAMQGWLPGRSSDPPADPDIRLGCPIPAVQSIYAEPGEAGSIVDWLLQATCVVFDARTEDNAWVRISSQENKVSRPGWVAASQVVLEPGWEDLPAISYLPRNDQIKACIIHADSLNIRNGPGTNYREIGHLLKDDCVYLTGRDAGNTWAAFEGGWLSTFYLQVYGNLHDLPVLKAPPPDFLSSKWD